MEQDNRIITSLIIVLGFIGGLAAGGIIVALFSESIPPSDYMFYFIVIFPIAIALSFYLIARPMSGYSWEGDYINIPIIGAILSFLSILVILWVVFWL